MITVHIKECVKIKKVINLNNFTFRRFEEERYRKQINNKQAEVDNLQRRIDGLYRDFPNGILNEDEYTKYKSMYTANLISAEKEKEILNQELGYFIDNKEEKLLWVERLLK